MRLFYIIFFLFTSFGFASAASQERQSYTQNKTSKNSFISSKKQYKICKEYGLDHESFQNDFINNSTAKFSTSFILLNCFVFLFLGNKKIAVKVIFKKLKYNYWCLFKMLYPKHVFW
ncbi:hypothetical protein DU508_10470 [Pedobacter chinensis]|uniref:Uncharacterized protein n=1 Tax=Pedobacter chinensis TaxID=2282421 RepID=A0A369PXV0_9SPHI|nr:hypothetical protein DU508_10470 [Pedobacter chinensis]